jgi:hypothetical protein
MASWSKEFLKGNTTKKKRLLFIQLFGAFYIFNLQPGLCYKDRLQEHVSSSSTVVRM